MNAQAAVLTHPVYLLEEPAFDSRPLALLTRGEYQQVGPPLKGFLPIAASDGRSGYVPGALCAPQAAALADGTPPEVGLLQPVALYRSPTAGDQFSSRWIVAKDEPLRVLGREGSFVQIERHDGQRGYVPAILCHGGPPAKDAPTVRLIQPVSLYASAAPGSQLDSRWIVSQAEPLLLLGRDGRFALVQRESGQLGYVPAVLLGQPAADTLLPIGPADLGWITLGGLWGLINWGGMAALLAQPLLPEEQQPYAALALLMGVALLLWLGSRRRVAARSFVAGMLLAYAYLHLATGGRATLWR